MLNILLCDLVKCECQKSDAAKSLVNRLFPEKCHYTNSLNIAVHIPNSTD